MGRDGWLAFRRLPLLHGKLQGNLVKKKGQELWFSLVKQFVPWNENVKNNIYIFQYLKQFVLWKKDDRKAVSQHHRKKVLISMKRRASRTQRAFSTHTAQT